MTAGLDPVFLRRAHWLAAGSWLLLLAITLSIPQGLHFFDPVLPLRALLQWDAGESPHWNILQRVDPADLSHDRSEWLGWWAPGTSLLVLPGLIAGVQPGHLLRAIALLAILAGSLGWIRWFARFPLPATWIFALAVFIPWMRYSSANLFRYSAEVLAFGAAPWAFLALADLPARITQGGVIAVALTGLSLGLSYWLKFSLLVTILAAVAGLAAWWFVGAIRGRISTPRLHVSVVFLLSLALAPLAWQLLTKIASGSTPLGGPRGLTWSGIDLVFLFGNPALAAADAFGPIFFALVHPGLLGLGGHTLSSVAWFGVPGGLLFGSMLISAWRRDGDQPHVAIGASAVFFASGALALLRIAGDVDQMPRHLAPVSLAALPLALAEGRRWWVDRVSCWRRAMLVSALIVYVAAPLLFGVAYVFTKANSNRATTVSSQSVAVLSVPTDEALVSHLQKLYRGDPGAILVVPDPEMSLLWPGRSMWQFAGASIGEDLQHSYHGVPPNFRWAARQPVLLHVVTRTGDQLPDVLRASGFTPTAPSWQAGHYSLLSGYIPSSPPN